MEGIMFIVAVAAGIFFVVAITQATERMKGKP